MSKQLTRDQLLSDLRSTAEKLEENRNQHAPNFRYPLADIVMTAFSAFYFQQSSFLSHENDLSIKQYRENCNTLFSCKTIPSMQTVRNVLDPITPEGLYPAFSRIFARLDRSGLLGKLRFSEQLGILIALDGLDYYESTEISCCQCMTYKRKEEVSYRHKLVCAGIAHPSEKLFIPLFPEFVVPQDGARKQDCEQVAAGRWLERFRKHHRTVRGTVLLDNLYCNHPFLSRVLAHRLNFIAAAKPGGNKALYEWVERSRRGNDTHKVVPQEIQRSGKQYQVSYEYLNDIPVRDSADALRVNFCSLVELERRSGKTRRFDYTTNIKLTDQNVGSIVSAGRKRWRIENENNNTLKNQGYYFDHNYGHGKQHLSSVIATLILYSFLTHTILRMIGRDGIVILLTSGRARRVYFELFRTCLRLFSFSNWEELYRLSMKALGLS